WVTNTAASSIRLYRESKLTPLQLGPGERIRVPMGFASFPFEAPSPPRRWVERGYEVRRWTDMPRGGHFAAWEEPELLAKDIREFFRPPRAPCLLPAGEARAYPTSAALTRSDFSLSRSAWRPTPPFDISVPPSSPGSFEPNQADGRL